MVTEKINEHSVITEVAIETATSSKPREQKEKVRVHYNRLLKRVKAVELKLRYLRKRALTGACVSDRNAKRLVLSVGKLPTEFTF